MSKKFKKVTLTTLSGVIVASNMPLHTFAGVMNDNVGDKPLNQAVVLGGDLDVDKERAIVSIPDPNLEAAIRETLGIWNTGITEGDMLRLIDLTAKNRGIYDLTGLEYATNLRELNLSGNRISDISALSSLTAITYLDLGDNQISDASALRQLVKLYNLSLRNNQIRDASPLSGMADLMYLNLRFNQISDISALSGLKKLIELNLDANEISNISVLGNMKSLTELYFHKNQVEDISVLSNLTRLKKIGMSNNQVSDISILSSMNIITFLDLSGNRIEDISPLRQLVNLDNLNLSRNRISDFSTLEQLPDITHLNLGTQTVEHRATLKNGMMLNPFIDEKGLNIPLTKAPSGIRTDGTNSNIIFDNPINGQSYQVTASTPTVTIEAAITLDIEYINIPDPNLEAAIRETLNKPTGDITKTDMENLTELHAGGRDIHDLTGLEYAVNLVSLDLQRNEVEDLTPIANLSNLKELNLAENSFSDTTVLSNLAGLTQLMIQSNNITDINFVSDLKNLTWLDFGDNEVSDLTPLSELKKLEVLYANGNQIEDLSPLRELDKIKELYIHENQVQNIEVLSNLNNLELIEISNNKIADFSSLSNLTNLTTFTAYNQDITLELPVGYKQILNPFKDKDGNYMPLVLSKGSMSADNRYIIFDSIEAGDMIQAEIQQEPYRGNVGVDILEDVELPVITIQQNKVGIGDKELAIEVSDGYYPIERIVLPDGTEVLGNQADYLATTGGEYAIKVYDIAGNEFIKTVNIVVERPIESINHAPVIEANDVVLTVGDTFNALDNVLAIDEEDGEVPVIVVFENVDTTTVGAYKVTYQATDLQGASSQKTITVTVQPKPSQINHVPVIEASNVVIYQGQPLDLMTLATAFDKEDGELPVKLIASDLDTTQVGIYKVTYEAIDSKSARVVKTISIAVRENLGAGYYTKDIKVPMTAVFDIETILQEIAKAEGLTDIKIIETNLNPSVEGEYDVTFEGKDKDEYKVIQTIKVTIEAETVDDSQKEEVQVETGLTSGITTSLGGLLGLIGVIILGRKKK